MKLLSWDEAHALAQRTWGRPPYLYFVCQDEGIGEPSHVFLVGYMDEDDRPETMGRGQSWVEAFVDAGVKL